MIGGDAVEGYFRGMRYASYLSEKDVRTLGDFRRDRAQRIDLVVHLHGTNLRGHGRTDSTASNDTHSASRESFHLAHRMAIPRIQIGSTTQPSLC